LDGETMPDYPNKSLKSNNHNIEKITTNKKSLAVGDTKRVFHSREKAYAPGHYRLTLSEDILEDISEELVDELINELVDEMIKTE
jgi:D-lyxose ketol-isomerase